MIEHYLSLVAKAIFVENILLEMFADVNYCRTRIIDEIVLYQEENLAVNN